VMDGDRVKEYQPVATIKGSFSSILKGERTALNFLQRMSGISTLVSKYVDAVSGTNAKIVDTRKTLPGHRILDKYAVKIGGGDNHRINLSDGILIKDNHINFLKNNGYSLSEIINKARLNAGFGLKIEIEVETYKDAVNSVKSGADIVLLDNMPLDEMEKTVNDLRTIDKNVLIEASGGIGLNNVSNIAKTGVDIISVGALTHSVIAHDFSLISSCEYFTE
ncbi:MAG: carboxylating nicotinate-nucleotide diphosphorylase, partial [SAR202 cluster bacterium]|nr:carboxylating nicotinate-nucleotide diphosphorylase [SAR202 cluster bacterium]